MEILNLKTPDDGFTAVQVEASPDGGDWRVVGAEPVLGKHVAASCHLEPSDQLVRLLWVAEKGGVLPAGPYDLTPEGRARIARGGRNR
jgi:hypothetical protein